MSFLDSLGVHDLYDNSDVFKILKRPEHKISLIS